MRIGKKVLMAVALCLFVTMPVLAGPLAAPANFTATVVDTDLVCDWDDVLGAAKYSVDIECVVTFTDDMGTQTVTVDVSYSAVPSNLTVATSTILDDVKAKLTITGVLQGMTVDAAARVKALNPGKGAGRQNNPFSEAVALQFVI